MKVNRYINDKHEDSLFELKASTSSSLKSFKISTDQDIYLQHILQLIFSGSMRIYITPVKRCEEKL